MDAALLTPSKYIKAIDFKGRDVTMTIAAIKIEELEREDNTKERKGIVTFVERPQGWVLNVTNVRCLMAMWGRETDNWLGKKVVLYPEPSEQSESGVAIRVRGSPDLQQDVTFTLKLARKKARQVVLRATGKKAAVAVRPAAPANAPRAVPAPAPETSDREPTDEDLAAQEPIDFGGVTSDGRIVP